MSAGDLQRLLSSAFGYHAQRTVQRLAGPTGQEDFWEPVERCWTVRLLAGNGFTADRAWPPPGFVEHIHDEFIHHAAEIALLRALYRAQARQTAPP